MSQKHRNPKAAKPQAPAGHDTTPPHAKPVAARSPEAAAQTAKPTAPTPEELMGKLQTLANVVLRLATQVRVLSERQQSLEKSMRGRGELRTTSEPSSQAKPPEAELSGMH